MNLLPFFEWMEALAFSKWARESEFANAGFNLVHLLGLVVLIGSVLIVDLRLLGRGIKRQPLAQVARDARPWMIGGLAVMVITGVPQVMALAMKQYYSDWFFPKMVFLAIAVVFSFTVRHKITQADEARVAPIWRALVAVVSITLWLLVAICGRLIGLLSG
jgi:hypothetical protein